MTCTGYSPAFGVGQLDGTTFAGSNCNTWSAGKACDDDTCGKQKPSSSQVRLWTGDTSGGTNLAQVHGALKAHTYTRLDVRYRYPWREFVRRVNGGESAILQGWYRPIRDSRFRGSESFQENHSMFVKPRLVTMDPLADGRRPGIYDYRGETYPEALLRAFAGKLNLSGDPDLYRPLGDGFCYAAFTRDNDANYQVTIRPQPGKTTRSWVEYVVVNDRIQTHIWHKPGTRGFQAACSPPDNVLTQSGRVRVSLVQIIEGGYKGRWVSSVWSDPT